MRNEMLGVCRRESVERRERRVKEEGRNGLVGMQQPRLNVVRW